jgi:hypothetical protein
MEPIKVGENRLAITRLREHRELAISALQDAFAHDVLDVEEFERRVTLAHRSDSLAELDALTSDLALEVGGERPATSTGAALAVTPEARPLQTIRGLMSATTRSGPWSVPRRLEVRALMSSTVLDFREARFPPGEVELDLRAVMSSVEIIVPPGLPVETEGSAVLGVFDDVQRAPHTAEPDAPRLKVRGSAFMSAVEIRMRLPGETEREHRLRARRDLRAARRQLRS